MKVSVKNNKIKYTILCDITAFLTYIYFIINGKSFVWHIDGYDQHMVALTMDSGFVKY